jgi:hypothetical protein
MGDDAYYQLLLADVLFEQSFNYAKLAGRGLSAWLDNWDRTDYSRTTRRFLSIGTPTT